MLSVALGWAPGWTRAPRGPGFESAVHQQPPRPRHHSTLGEPLVDSGEKPAETLRLLEDPTKEDHPQPGQSLLPSPNDDSWWSRTHCWLLKQRPAQGTTRGWSQGRDGTQTGLGSRFPQTSITPVSPLPKLGVLRRGSAAQRFLHTTARGRAPQRDGLARGGMGQHSECPPASPPPPRKGVIKEELRATVPASPSGGGRPALRQAGNGGQETQCDRE